MAQATAARSKGTVAQTIAYGRHGASGDAMPIQIVALAGEFDISNVREIERAIEHGITAGARSFIADLSEVEFLDGRAVHALVDGWKRAARRNGRFVLVNPPARIWRVVILIGVSRTFRTFASRQDALGYLAEASRLNPARGAGEPDGSAAGKAA